jgi:hypothetical protein
MGVCVVIMGVDVVVRMVMRVLGRRFGMSVWFRGS